MAETNPGERLSTPKLILVPGLITLVITVLRLVGELQHWSKLFFNPLAGGGGAIVGISWLPLVLGPYFAVKLIGVGQGPKSTGKAIGFAALGLAVMVLGGLIWFRTQTRVSRQCDCLVVTGGACCRVAGLRLAGFV
jgi:hypothetical protein